MSIIRRHAVLQTSSQAFPESRPPDPRRALEIRAAEDTDLIVRVIDDGGSPVPKEDLMVLRLTVRPRPLVDDEKLLRLDASPLPLEGPNIWKFAFTSLITKQKSTQFSRGFYDVVLLRRAGESDERRDFVIAAAPFRLLGSPGAP